MRALWLVALVTACGFEPPAQPMRGAHPISNPGTGSFYPLGATVTVDGSGSFDPDGTIVAYRWSFDMHPAASTAGLADPDAATTTFEPNQVGTYWLRLLVTDDADNTDASTLRIVATGAITDVDAGPAGAVSWLGTAQLSGAVTTLPGQVATYSWDFVSRPPGSVASLTSSGTLTPTFVADAAGTYVVALAARVGDEVRYDTTTVEATASGVALGAGSVAYTYAKMADRIIGVRDVGHAEVARIDPTTGAETTLNIGAFTPRSIAVDPLGQLVAVGGPGMVATVGVVSQLVLGNTRSAPGCTAAQVTVPYSARVDCFPADGTIEPISSVNMTTGAVTQIPCPVQFPNVTLGAAGNWMYMVDGASSELYWYDASATPPLPLIHHGSLAGIAPPVIAAGTNQPYAITGNGLAVNPDATLRFDLHTAVSAGAFSGTEIAVVSGAQLKVFLSDFGQPLKLTATLPAVNGVSPTAQLVAYSADGHRLIIVARTPAGDVVYTVPR